MNNFLTNKYSLILKNALHSGSANGDDWRRRFTFAPQCFSFLASLERHSCFRCFRDGAFSNQTSKIHASNSFIIELITVNSSLFKRSLRANIMSFPLLTKNGIANIQSGKYMLPVVVQVLAYKKQAANVRLILSDGETSGQNFVVSSPQIIEQFEQGIFEKFTIAQIEGLECNPLDGKKVSKSKRFIMMQYSKFSYQVFVITQLKCLKRGNTVGAKIGDPTQADKSSTSMTGNQTPKRPSGQSTAAATSSPAVNRPSGDASTVSTIPIDGINPFQGRINIKGRVTNKQPIRTWNKVLKTYLD